MPDELKGGFQTTPYIWHWLKVQRVSVSYYRLFILVILYKQYTFPINSTRSLRNICYQHFQTLVSSAVMGIVVGMCCAFPILTIATHNIIIGLLATLSIGGIIICVIGVIPLAGWKLGVSTFDKYQ